MERRMRTALRIGLPLFAVLAAAAVALSACDSANILAAIATEVKKSTGKLLVVSSVSPANTSSGVNPMARMTVTFDRSIDVSTISGANVTISPTPDPVEAPGFHLDFTFVEATKTLYIDSDPWLGGDADYVLTITSRVKGSDGSELEADYSWGFHTIKAPRGTLTLQGGKLATNKGPGQTLSFDITCDKALYSYRVGNTEAECRAAGWQGPLIAGLNPGVTSAAYSFPSGSVDGPHDIYYQFEDATYVDSAIRVATLTLDTVKPTITIYTPTVYHNIANQATGAVPSLVGSDDRSGIDTTTWLWSNGGNPVTISSPSVQAPYLSMAGEGGPYAVTVTVSDKAGNVVAAAATVNVIRDTVAPSVPVFNAGTTASPTVLTEPTWAWTAGGGGGQGYDLYLVDPIGDRVWKDTYKPTMLAFPYDAKYLDYLRGNKIYPLRDGTWTLYVRDADVAGNHSAYSSRSILTTPVIPLDRATGVPGLSVTFQWRAFGKGAPYALSINSKPLRTTYKDIATNSFTCPVDLSGLYLIEWFVVDQGGAKSAAYSFTTGK